MKRSRISVCLGLCLFTEGLEDLTCIKFLKQEVDLSILSEIIKQGHHVFLTPYGFNFEWIYKIGIDKVKQFLGLWAINRFVYLFLRVVDCTLGVPEVGWSFCQNITVSVNFLTVAPVLSAAVRNL